MYGDQPVTAGLPDKLRREYLERLSKYDPVRSRAADLVIARQLASTDTQHSLKTLLNKKRPEALKEHSLHELESKFLASSSGSVASSKASHKTMGPPPRSVFRESRSTNSLGSGQSEYFSVHRGGGFMTTAHTSEGRVALDPKRRPVHSPGPAVLPDPYKDNLRPSSPLRPASPPGMQFGTSSEKRFKDPPTNDGPKRVNNRAKTAGVRITTRSQTLSIDRSTDSDYDEPMQYRSSHKHSEPKWTMGQGFSKRPRPMDTSLLYDHNRAGTANSVRQRTSHTLSTSTPSFGTSGQRYGPLHWKNTELRTNTMSEKDNAGASPGPVYGMHSPDSGKKHIDYGPSHRLVMPKGYVNVPFSSAYRFMPGRSFHPLPPASINAAPTGYGVASTVATEPARPCTVNIGAKTPEMDSFPVNKLSQAPGVVYNLRETHKLRSHVERAPVITHGLPRKHGSIQDALGH